MVSVKFAYKYTLIAVQWLFEECAVNVVSIGEDQ